MPNRMQNRKQSRMQTQERDLARQLIEVIPKTMFSIRHHMRTLAQADLTVMQFRILARLNYESPATNRQLADCMGISVPAMSRLVDVLVKKGLVTRVQHETDRRQVQLSMTDLGLERFLTIQEEAQGHFSEQFSHLEHSQKRTLAEAFNILQGIFQ